MILVSFSTEFVALSGREIHNALRVLRLDVVQVLLQLLQLPVQVLHKHTTKHIN